MLTWELVQSVVARVVNSDATLRLHHDEILDHLRPRVIDVIARVGGCLGRSPIALTPDAGSPPVCVSATSIDMGLDASLDKRYAELKENASSLQSLVSVGSLCDADRVAQLRSLRELQMTTCWRVARVVVEHLRARSDPALVSSLSSLSALVRAPEPVGASDQVRAARALLRCLPVDAMHELNRELRSGAVAAGDFLRYASAVSLDRYQIGGILSSEWGDPTDVERFRSAYRSPAPAALNMNAVVPCVAPGIASTLLLDSHLEDALVVQFVDDELRHNVFGDAAAWPDDILDAVMRECARVLMLPPSAVSPMTCVDVAPAPHSVEHKAVAACSASASALASGVGSNLVWDEPMSVAVRFLDIWPGAAKLPVSEDVFFAPLAPVGGVSSVAPEDSAPCVRRAFQLVPNPGATSSYSPTHREISLTNAHDVVSTATALCRDFATANSLCARLDACAGTLSFDASVDRIACNSRVPNPVASAPTVLDAAVLRTALASHSRMPTSAFALSWLVREWRLLASRASLLPHQYAYLRGVLFADIATLVVHACRFHPAYLEAGVLLGLVRPDGCAVRFSASNVLPEVQSSSPRRSPSVSAFGDSSSAPDPASDPASSAPGPVLPPLPLRMAMARVAGSLNLFALVLGGHLVPIADAYPPVDGVVVPALVSTRDGGPRVFSLSMLPPASGAHSEVYARAVRAVCARVSDWGVFARLHACPPVELFDRARGIALEQYAWGESLPGTSLLATDGRACPPSRMVEAVLRLASVLQSPAVSNQRLAADMLVRDLTLSFAGAGAGAGAGTDTGAGAVDEVSRLYTRLASELSQSRVQPSFLSLVRDALAPFVHDGTSTPFVRALDAMSGTYARPYRASDVYAAHARLPPRSRVAPAAFSPRAFVAIDEDLYNASCAHEAREAVALASLDVYEPPGCPYGVTRVLHSAHALLSRAAPAPAPAPAPASTLDPEIAQLFAFVRDADAGAGPPERAPGLTRLYRELLDARDSVPTMWARCAAFMRSSDALRELIERVCKECAASSYESAREVMCAFAELSRGCSVQYLSGLCVSTILMLASYSCVPRGETVHFDWGAPLPVSEGDVDARRDAFLSYVLRGARGSVRARMARFRELVCVPAVARLEQGWLKHVGPAVVERAFGSCPRYGCEANATLVAAAYAVISARSAPSSSPLTSPLAACVYMHAMSKAMRAAHADACRTDRWSGSFPSPRLRSRVWAERFLPSHGPPSAVVTHVAADALSLLRDRVCSRGYDMDVLQSLSSLRRDSKNRLVERTDEDVCMSVRTLVYGLLANHTDLTQRQNDFRDTTSRATLYASYVIETLVGVVLAHAVDRARSKTRVVVRTLRHSAIELHRVVFFATHVLRKCLVETACVLDHARKAGALYPVCVLPGAAPVVIPALRELAQRVCNAGDQLSLSTPIVPGAVVSMMRDALSTDRGRELVHELCRGILTSLADTDATSDLCVLQLYYIAAAALTDHHAPTPPVLLPTEAPVTNVPVCRAFLAQAENYIDDVVNAPNADQFVSLLHEARTQLDAIMFTSESLVGDLMYLVTIATDTHGRVMSNTLVMLVMIDSLRALVGHALGPTSLRVWEEYRGALYRARNRLPSCRTFAEPLLVLPVTDAQVRALRASYANHLYRDSSVYRDSSYVQSIFGFLGAAVCE